MTTCDSCGSPVEENKSNHEYFTAYNFLFNIEVEVREINLPERTGRPKNQLNHICWMCKLVLIKEFINGRKENLERHEKAITHYLSTIIKL